MRRSKKNKRGLIIKYDYRRRTTGDGFRSLRVPPLRRPPFALHPKVSPGPRARTSVFRRLLFVVHPPSGRFFGQFFHAKPGTFRANDCRSCSRSRKATNLFKATESESRRGSLGWLGEFKGGLLVTAARSVYVQKIRTFPPTSPRATTVGT